MKKLSSKYFVAMIVILLFFFGLFKISLISKNQLIVNAFNESEAEILTTNIICQGNFEEKVEDIELLKQLVKKILYNFDISSSSLTEGENHSDSFLEFWSYGRTENDTYIKVVASSKKEKEKDVTTNSIILVLSGNTIYDSLYEIEEKAIEIIKPYVSKININSTITGTYPQKLSKENIEQIVRNILKNSKATKVKMEHTNNAYNINAYSPLYDNYAIIDKEKVNLNISVRYNSYEHKTYISLSSPRTLDTLE